MFRLSLVVIVLSVLTIILYQPAESNNFFIDLLSSDLASKSNGAHVLLLTAHPDDECMFFAPTVRALTADKGAQMPSTQVYSLCLSIGDADGLGNIRREELGRSLDVLGVHKSNRWVIDHPDLKDNITSHWSPDTIARVLYPYIKENNISTVLTFDQRGVSGHPNHISLLEGVKRLLVHHRHSPSIPTPKLFTLITHPIATKYTGILAPLVSKSSLYQSHLLVLSMQIIRNLGTWTILPPQTTIGRTVPMVVSGLQEYITALRAMFQHQSQLVWFRWLYVLFSRYMWVNEWAEIRMDDSVPIAQR